MAAPLTIAGQGLNTEPLRPFTHSASVTASDSTTFTPTRALYVAGAGNITVTMAGDGAQQLFTSVPAGTVLPVSCTQVRATGTAATNIVALW